MKEVAELLKAISSLLWPILAFIFLLIFKRQLADALGRIKKGKFLGQEFELEESLTQLHKATAVISEEVASASSMESDQNEEKIEDKENLINNILSQASRSPKVALMLLSTEIEREAKEILASVGRLDNRKYLAISQAMNELDNQFGGLPGHVSIALKNFSEIRNRIIHGSSADEGNIISAIDSGINILKALQALPRETNIVSHPEVDVYHDNTCKNKNEGVKGIILETSSAGGAKVFNRIFPTTKTHFQKGRRVAWEWDSNKIWGQAWYKDPETQQIKLAWSNSHEFIGRHLDDL